MSEIIKVLPKGKKDLLEQKSGNRPDTQDYLIYIPDGHDRLNVSTGQRSFRELRGTGHVTVHRFGDSFGYMENIDVDDDEGGRRFINLIALPETPTSDFISKSWSDRAERCESN